MSTDRETSALSIAGVHSSAGSTGCEVTALLVGRLKIFQKFYDHAISDFYDQAISDFLKYYYNPNSGRFGRKKAQGTLQGQRQRSRKGHH